MKRSPSKEMLPFLDVELTEDTASKDLIIQVGKRMILVA
jgi:hypothetical protein